MNGLGTLKSQPSVHMPNFDDTRADASRHNLDPFKFSHGLSGVDQQTNYRLVHMVFAALLVLTITVACIQRCTCTRDSRHRQSSVSLRRTFYERLRARYAISGQIKNHILYAPLWEAVRGDGANVKSSLGDRALPTRSHTLLLCVYSLINAICCLAIRDQPRAQKYAELRGRCGTFATFNLVFAVLFFALRNNPLIWLLHISYDTFNLFHRWIARMVVLQSIAHVFAFGINAYHVEYNGQAGWHSIQWILEHSVSYRWGGTSLLTFTSMAMHSFSPLRHAFYETFLTMHRLGAVMAITEIHYHIGKHMLPQLPWVYLVIVLLACEYLFRSLRMVYVNVCWKQRAWTQFTIESLPGEATRVTFVLPRPWYGQPGCHVHVYLPRIALWSSHPFSVAWVESSGYASLSQEKSFSSVEDLKMEQGPSTISCIIRARAGMTRTLYNLACSGEGNRRCMWGAVEGPYGGSHSLDSYGVVALFAAGVGITHQLLFVQRLLAGYASKTTAVQKILLVWSVTTMDAYDWVDSWLEDIAAMPHFRDIVCIRLYCTRTTSIELERRLLPR